MILSILALLALLWLRISGHGAWLMVEAAVSVLALCAAYDGHRKARAAAQRAETYVTPPGDGPARMAR